MNVNKKIVIITDGSESIQVIANSINKALTAYKTKICSGDTFTGTDLLSADAFILGCEKPNPPSFAYLSQMLSHINLVHKKCAVFSVNQKALDYLITLVHDCEASLGEPLFSNNTDASSIKKWIAKLLK